MTSLGNLQEVKQQEVSDDLSVCVLHKAVLILKVFPFTTLKKLKK